MSQELGPEARALLAKARHSREPTFTDRWAVRRNVAARIGAASAVATGVATTKAGATLLGGVKLSLLSHFAVATVAGATLATSAMFLHSTAMKKLPRVTAAASAPRRSHDAAVRPHSTVRASVATPEPEPRSVELSPESPSGESIVKQHQEVRAAPPAAVPRVKAVHPVVPSTVADEEVHSSSEPVAATHSRLLEEGRALAQVQSALSEQRGSDALRLLAIQSQQFTNGALAPERAAARVFALCAMGKQVESRSAAQHFAQAWPDSPLLSRVLATCK